MILTGQMLKERRKSLNLSLNEVSLATKINARVLQSIEEGDVDGLPSKSFLRGFVLSYAKYLKMDVDKVLDTFQEEMGSTIARPEEAVVPKNSWLKKIPFLNTASLTSGTLAVVGILILIGLIVTIKGLVDKYEKEGQVNEPPANVASIQPQPPKDPHKTADKALAPSVAVPPAKKAEPVKVEPEVVKQPPTKVAEVAKPPEPSKPKEVVEKPVEKPAEEKKKPKPKAKARSQEVIIEALDKVSISITVNNGDTKKITLQPNQVHTIKANGNVNLEFSDGGAVSLIHNGRDKGVPGDLGKPAKVKYP